MFGSRIKAGHTTGKYFYFNGTEVKDYGTVLPPEAVLYKEITMYHSASHFFIVPYNATVHQVNNGRQVEREENSEDGEQDAEADDDGGPDPTTVDWSVLSFHWNAKGTLISSSSHVKPKTTLCAIVQYVRTDQ
jgi:hypothetical protein